jgi:hypothetical protein
MCLGWCKIEHFLLIALGLPTHLVGTFLATVVVKRVFFGLMRPKKTKKGGGSVAKTHGTSILPIRGRISFATGYTGH